MYVFYILIPWLYADVQLAASEAFSSTANLIKLVEAEKDVLPLLYQYVEDEEKRVQEIHSYIEDIKNAVGYEEQHNLGLVYAGHPVNAYNLIKRWYRMSELSAADPKYKELAEQIKKHPTPTQSDFIGANSAILRLQRVFNLSAEQVYSGSVYGQQAAHKLRPDDCLTLGETALKNNEYDLSVAWLRLAEPGLKTQEQTQRCWTTFSTALEKMGEIDEAYHYAEAASNLVPEDLNLNTQVVRLRHLQTAGHWPTPWSRTVTKYTESYERLCRGEPDATSNPKVAKSLLCYYKKGQIPYVQYKHEILSWSPRIGMFYDVISDQDAETVIEKAYPLLFRGMIGDPKNPNESGIRVSKIAWLWDNDPFMKKLSARVKDITGLETMYRDVLSSAEPFQVVNYGMGGQYEAHVDYYEDAQLRANVPDYLQNTGDRIATFLYYLTHVPVGGSTVYPRANIRVAPVKNAAAFWYNAKLSGDFDFDTEHAGCPVLLGQKWVTNKWIREYGQEFRRLCGLKKNTVDNSIE